MVNKRLLVGVGCMLVGGILVVTGLLGIPGASVVKILLGGAIGFVGYVIFEKRRGYIPSDLNLG